MSNGQWAREPLSNEELLANGQPDLSLRPVPPTDEEVDDLADEIVEEYNDPGWRPWYCGVIRDFGVDRVNKWRLRARTGNVPVAVFKSNVRKVREWTRAEQGYGSESSQSTASSPQATKQQVSIAKDTDVVHQAIEAPVNEKPEMRKGIEGAFEVIYNPGDFELTDTGIEAALDEGVRMLSTMSPKGQGVDPYKNS